MNKEKLHREFGKLVQTYRKEKGLTQEDLAEAINKSVETVSNIERGFASTRISTAYEISQALNIDITKLFEVNKIQNQDEISKEINKQLNKADEETKVKILKLVKVLTE